MYPRVLSIAFLFVAVVACVSHAAAAETTSGPVFVVPATAKALHVSVDLPEGFSADVAKSWRLIESDVSTTAIPVDILPAIDADGTVKRDRSRLVASIAPRDGATGLRRFTLTEDKAQRSKMAPSFQWTADSPASLRLDEHARPVFVYNHGDITNEKVPASDARRTRGCYLHPIYGLDGEVLTDDSPRDHYHHHGLFWAWPHVEIDGRHYDLWMGRNIRQKFVRWLAGDEGTAGGTQSGTIGVENGWFVGDEKVMIERVWLTAHKAIDGAQAIDLTLVLIPVDRPITLRGAENKSYGGLCIRFAVPPRQRPTITVPDGVTDKDLSMTRLAWADLAYPFGEKGKPSGASLMISKTHPDFPPMWLTRHYGPLCIGFPGVESKTFEANEPLTLRYRLWIHRDAVEPTALGDAYEAYTAGER
ncbi:MAG TPA: hypothetical protein DD670_01185, partial [Planctomycetaceae bacterium]|nr:hypothetical protein [Planctomycetaceae bacterium]